MRIVLNRGNRRLQDCLIDGMWHETLLSVYEPLLERLAASGVASVDASFANHLLDSLFANRRHNRTTWAKNFQFDLFN